VLGEPVARPAVIAELQNIILTTVAAFAFFGGIGFYLRWSYLGWRDGQRLSREPFLKVLDAHAVLANAPKTATRAVRTAPSNTSETEEPSESKP
jgi:hypothetical protein